ncbi:MAG: mycoredoxin [Sporichthyaceae bacterium]|jgi:mycoredoxin|nr:mycoredoxin [Sporichthyaceae bacterium]
MTTATAAVTMYSTPWCGYCKRLKRQMLDAGIAFDEIDIEQEPAAAQVVEEANHGNQTVPTLVFADGTALTNPSLAQITDRLATIGS